MLRKLTTGVVGAAIGVVTVVAIGVAADYQATPPKTETSAGKPAVAPAASKTTKAKGARMAAVLETNAGTIVIKFHEADAPKTVANFKKLVSQKFYD